MVLVGLAAVVVILVAALFSLVGSQPPRPAPPPPRRRFKFSKYYERYEWLALVRHAEKLVASGMSEETAAREAERLHREAARERERLHREAAREHGRALEERRRQVEEALGKLEISEDPADYVRGERDAERQNAEESAYRQKHLLTLLEYFGNQCAKCGTKENGLDLDHFFMPKSRGGMFRMQRIDGVFVNNAIPLCQKCNRSKQHKSYRSFFSDVELTQILPPLNRMHRRLNGVHDP